MLRLIHQHEIGAFADLDQPGVQLALTRRVAVAETERDLGWNIAQRRQHRHHPHDAQGLHARSCRPVGAQNDLIQLGKLARGVQRQQRRAFIAVMHNLKRRFAVFAKADDLIIRQRRMSAVDVPNNIRARLKHHIGVDQARSGDRRPAGVDRALHPVFTRPANHLVRGLAVLDRAKPDLSDQGHARCAHLAEMFFLKPLLQQRRTCVHLDTRGAEILVPALRCNRHRDGADGIVRAPRHVDLARRNQRGNAAMQGRIDPSQLLLARGVIAHNGVDMAVDQTGGKGHVMRVDNRGGPLAIEILFRPPCRNPAVQRDQAIPVENRFFHLARQDHANVADHKFCGGV